MLGYQWRFHGSLGTLRRVHFNLAAMAERFALREYCSSAADCQHN